MGWQRLVGALVVASLAAVPASADTPDECTSGPAYDASAQQPHRVDGLEDVAVGATVNGTSAPHPYDAQLDLRAIWIGVEETAPGSRIPRYTINTQVSSLAQHPVGAVYYIGIDSYTWASAAALPDGAWEFGTGQYTATGPFFGQIYTRLEPTSGSVDRDAGTIRIEIPHTRVPDQETRPYGRSGMRGGVNHSVVAEGGMASSEWFVAADTALGDTGCTAVLNGLRPEDEAQDG